MFYWSSKIVEFIPVMSNDNLLKQGESQNPVDSPKHSLGESWYFVFWQLITFL